MFLKVACVTILVAFFDVYDNVQLSKCHCSLSNHQNCTHGSNKQSLV